MVWVFILVIKKPVNALVDSDMEIKVRTMSIQESPEAIWLNYYGEDVEGFDKVCPTLIGLGSYSYQPKKLNLDLKIRQTPLLQLSIIKPLVLELKPLSTHMSGVSERLDDELSDNGSSSDASREN
ncbi:hypothetical protein HAX54_053147 [Datura stramonium]|uniref:Uncharacterized protein n=1 Tax=Datura stramonium TaxID=4076 RepID=A0ABS8T0Z7_DATST|nr:hypothetical protein [Datura stramonium]